MTAAQLLRKGSSPAAACMLAADKLLSDSWFSWEPESIWLSLKRDHHIDTPLMVREKLLAGRVLVTTGTFWYEVHAFSKTCGVFNNTHGNYAVLEDVPVAHLCAGVSEAHWITQKYEGDTNRDLDVEPLVYSALRMASEGLVLAPPPLEKVQSHLDRLLCNADAKKLQKEVAEAWAEAPSSKSLEDAPYPETPAGVQLARRAAIHLYVETAQRSRQAAVQAA